MTGLSASWKAQNGWHPPEQRMCLVVTLSSVGGRPLPLILRLVLEPRLRVGAPGRLRVSIGCNGASAWTALAERRCGGPSPRRLRPGGGRFGLGGAPGGGCFGIGCAGASIHDDVQCYLTH